MESRWQRAPWRKEPFKIQWKEQNGPAKMGEARRRSMQSIRNFNYSSSSGRIASPTSYCSYLLTLKLMLTWPADFEVDLQSELLVWPSRKAAGCRSLIESSSNSSFTVPSWEFSRCAAVNCFFSSPPSPLHLFRSVYSDEHYNNYQLMIKCI